MEIDVALASIGILGVLVVFGSAVLRTLPVSGPMLALGIGVVLGPEVAGLVEVADGLPVLHAVSEVVVAIALMAVALRFPWPVVADLRRPLAFMLLVGMVAMAAVVAILASWLLGVGVGAAILIGGCLAPTDPVLSSSIVTGVPAVRTLPQRVRALLSAESGFNDGLALPLVVAGIVLVREEAFDTFALDGLWSVALAIVAGWLIGTAAGDVFSRLDDAHDIEDSAFFVFTLVLAIGVLGAVNLLQGDGILAVFVAGLAYNRSVGQRTFEKEREVDEGINRVLILPVFLLFGTVLPWTAWAERPLTLLGFAAAVLVLRRVPLVLATKRAVGLDRTDAAFYGWFGPMGVAALFFVTLAHERGATTPAVWPAVASVVAVSTLVHGVTAAPGRSIYARVAGERGDPDAE